MKQETFLFSCLHPDLQVYGKIRALSSTSISTKPFPTTPRGACLPTSFQVQEGKGSCLALPNTVLEAPSRAVACSTLGDGDSAYNRPLTSEELKDGPFHSIVWHRVHPGTELLGKVRVREDGLAPVPAPGLWKIPPPRSLQQREAERLVY